MSSNTITRAVWPVSKLIPTKTSSISSWLYVYPSDRGFLSTIRPVLAVDGTLFKSKYMGILFLTVAQDPDKHIYPLVWTIGNVNHWSGFSWSYMVYLGSCSAMLTTDTTYTTSRAIWRGNWNKRIQSYCDALYEGCKAYIPHANFNHHFSKMTKSARQYLAKK